MPRTYVVRGGTPLHGQVTVGGGKNASTKLIVASLLSSEPVILHNVPRIGDVELTLEMVKTLGTQATWVDEHSLHLATPHLGTAHVPETFSARNRIPILLTGPLLARVGHAEIPVLGGDDIGGRPVNFHIDGYRALGAAVEEKNGLLEFSAKKLRGDVVTLAYPSVMATENLLLAGVFAEGITVIKNAAVEPEILDLVDFLQKMGAVISHETDRTYVVEGVPWLRGAEHTVIPDRNEAVSLACAAIATKGSIFVEGARQQDLRTFLNVLRKIGAGFQVRENGIAFSHVGTLKPLALETGVHPGFMTDWQPPFAILLTQAEGTSVLHETVSERRFGYLEALKALEADVELFQRCLGGRPCRFQDRDFAHSAVIKGPTPLRARDMEVPDLRAGFSYVVAALLSQGVSRITGAEKIERGYEDLVEKLRGLGADISVVEEDEKTRSENQSGGSA